MLAIERIFESALSLSPAVLIFVMYRFWGPIDGEDNVCLFFFICEWKVGASMKIGS